MKNENMNFLLNGRFHQILVYSETLCVSLLDNNDSSILLEIVLIMWSFDLNIIVICLNEILVS